MDRDTWTLRPGPHLPPSLSSVDIVNSLFRRLLDRTRCWTYCHLSLFPDGTFHLSAHSKVDTILLHPLTSLNQALFSLVLILSFLSLLFTTPRESIIADDFNIHLGNPTDYLSTVACCSLQIAEDCGWQTAASSRFSSQFSCACCHEYTQVW